MNFNAEWEIHNTLAQVLGDSGYETAWVGRSMHQTPVQKRFGFEYMVYSDHRDTNNPYDEFLRRNMTEGETVYHGSGVMHNDYTARSFHLREALHATNWTVSEAQKFLRGRDTSRPFCMVVSFLAAHPPLIPPAFYLDRYLRTGVPDPAIGDWAERPVTPGYSAGVDSHKVDLTGEMLLSCRAGYYGLINHLDDQIRRLLNPVIGEVPMDDTVVMYTADHGEMLGDHYFFRKSTPYQGAVHIPMLLRVPPGFGFPKGNVVDRPVCLEDVMPTMLELAGVPVPDTVDGRSLVPLISGTPKVDWRESVHIECAGFAKEKPPFHALTDGSEKYIWFTDSGREQFFRLDDDPLECDDLVSEPGETEHVAAWRDRMIHELSGRPEGFSDGVQLIAGRDYPADGSAYRT